MGWIAIKTFLVLWVSQAVSLLGSALVEFSLAWYLTQKTGSATVLATAMLVAMLPPIFLGPMIGPLVDRWNRKRIMVVADLSVAMITLALVGLFFAGAVQVWHIYLAMVARAIGQAFHFPAMLASVPLVVPEKHLSRAAGLNQMLQGIVTIAAPPAGALLLGVLPMYGVLVIDIVTALIAVSCLLLIVIPQPERATLLAKASAFQDMIAGFRYIWQSRGLAMLMGLTAVLVFFFVPAFTLMPILVTEKLGGDVLRLGWLNSAFGLGMIAGGALLGVWGGFRLRIVTSFAGLMTCSLGTIAVGLTSTGVLFFVGLAASMVVGMGLSVANAPLMAIVQSVVPKDMQGRVHSLFGSINSAMMPLGLAIAGPAADAIGISSLFYVAGAATLVITFLALFSRTLMSVEAPEGRATIQTATGVAPG